MFHLFCAGNMKEVYMVALLLYVYQSVVKLGLISELDMIEKVRQRTGIEFVDLSKFELSKELLEIVTARVASHYGILPIRIEDKNLYIAISEPASKSLKDEIDD